MLNIAPNSLNWSSFLMSFLFTFLAILAVLLLIRWVSKNQFLNKLSPNKNRLKVLETLSIAPKQKIILIKFDGNYLLIGATPMNITLLSSDKELLFNSNDEDALKPNNSINHSLDKANKSWLINVLK